MRIFSILDESAASQIDLAFLLYYKLEKGFYIELPENDAPWETSLLFLRFEGEPDKPFFCQIEGKRKKSAKVIITGGISPKRRL